MEEENTMSRLERQNLEQYWFELLPQTHTQLQEMRERENAIFAHAITTAKFFTTSHGSLVAVATINRELKRIYTRRVIYDKDGVDLIKAVLFTRGVNIVVEVFLGKYGEYFGSYNQLIVIHGCGVYVWLATHVLNAREDHAREEAGLPPRDSLWSVWKRGDGLSNKVLKVGDSRLSLEETIEVIRCIF
ncbi:MAG: hypothetical protein G01um101466_726 [Parcubacteria group bacterium Gr01-1014_66]|nr:MAG: hypothetical protein G01um101466_726 [Parcubacteria group bacterium Gr01-1014_66]